MGFKKVKKEVKKDPNAIRDYTWNWVPLIPALGTGDTIASHTCTPAAGITVVSSTHTDTTTTMRVSGGAVGESYEIVTHVVTAGGEEDDITLVFQIAQQ